MSRLAFSASALLVVLFAAGAQLASAAQPRVRLMVAVADADAYERTMALVAEGRLTAVDGEAFVVVGDFVDARQGYSFGRALQRRLKLPFELLYDPGHPQADLAWARRPFVASQPQPQQPLPQQAQEALPQLAQQPLPKSQQVQKAQPQLVKPQQAQPRPRLPLLREALVYLYAVPKSPLQRQRLAHLLPQQSASLGSDRIRVGVFRRTPTGRRLLAAQQNRLDVLAISYERFQLDPTPLATTLASAQAALAPPGIEPGER
jgi:hypothetical protein